LIQYFEKAILHVPRLLLTSIENFSQTNMKKPLCFVLVGVLLIFDVSASALAAPPEDKWLNGAPGYERALQLQQELKVPLVVYFYADWCPYCQTLDARYLPVPEVQSYLKQVIKVRINPEHGRAERELAARYGITGYPAFFIIRQPSARPVQVSPFSQRGNMTPAEFARACAQAAPRAGITTRVVASRAATPAPVGSTANSGETLPTVAQVFKRYSDAVGSRAAQMRITSRVTKGRVYMPGMSDGGRFQNYAMAPNKTLSVMNVDNFGLARQGFDGKTGWESDQSGIRDASAERLARLSRSSEFYSALKLGELYARTRMLGKVKEGFRQVYKVEAFPRVGAPETLYFDCENGLLVKSDLQWITSRGPLRAEVYFNDFRDVDGIKIPFRITQTAPGLTYVFTIEDVKHNVPLDEAIFHKPNDK
jgi:thiol-disulfide isomerase/thioredoxin